MKPLFNFKYNLIFFPSASKTIEQSLPAIVYRQPPSCSSPLRLSHNPTQPHSFVLYFASCPHAWLLLSLPPISIQKHSELQILNELVGRLTSYSKHRSQAETTMRPSPPSRRLFPSFPHCDYSESAPTNRTLITESLGKELGSSRVSFSLGRTKILVEGLPCQPGHILL